MPAVLKEVIYKDFDIRFIAHPVTGKLIIKKNAESVKQALKNLILTSFFERPYEPIFGSGVRNMLFENYSAMTESDLRRAIEIAIDNFEPRVQLLDVRFGGDPDRNMLTISIIFRALNNRVPVTLNIDLQRVR